MLIKGLSRNISRFQQTIGVWFEALLRSDSGETEQAKSKEAGVLYFVVYKFAPMKVEHLALWVDDLEKMRQFYLAYFNMISSDRHANDGKGFASYFLSFGNGKNRVELMNRLNLKNEPTRTKYMNGIEHFAVAVGDNETVNKLTERLRVHGNTIVSEPRATGEGHYESVVLDPEGNHVKITARGNAEVEF